MDVNALDFTDIAPTQPAGAGITHEDGYLAGHGGNDLYWQAWQGDDEPNLVIALMHGYGEHSGRYHHVATALARAGYGVMAIDARGHGKSVGKRGHVDRYDDYAEDLNLLVDAADERWPGCPLFVIGHSNGGLIAIRHALRNDPRVVGYVVTSPFLGFNVEVPLIKALAGNLMSNIYPKLQLPTDLDASGVSRDSKVVKHYEGDPLIHGLTTARWFTEVKNAQTDTLERAKELMQPFLLLAAGDDKLVDPRATEEVYHRMGSHDRQFELFPELYHEILNEEPWEDIVRQIISWIEDHRPES